MVEPQDVAGQWLSQAEAALKLGWKQGRVTAARRSGRLQSRKNNRGEWLVLLPNGHPVEPESDLGQTGSPTEAELLAELREEIAELKHDLGRAEGLAQGQAAHIQSLEAEIAHLRRPWLARLVKAVRRR